jgi:exodeoxyribonuclease VII small subunit
MAEDDRFERLVERLEAIVKELEAGGTTLARAVALYREGIQVARAAEALLDEAEQLLNTGDAGEEAIEWLDGQTGAPSA